MCSAVGIERQNNNSLNGGMGHGLVWYNRQVPRFGEIELGIVCYLAEWFRMVVGKGQTAISLEWRSG